MGVGGFLRKLGFGSKPKSDPVVIGSQRGPVPEQVLNARPQPGFVQAARAERVQAPGDSGQQASERVQSPANGAPTEAAEYVSQWLSATEAKDLITSDAEGRPNLRLAGNGESLMFTVGDTGRFITAGSRQLPRLGIWAFNVRGTNHMPGNGRTEEASPRSKLKLVREPANEFDPNAIAVLSERGKILGYVNKGNAARMAKLLDKGAEFEVISLHGSGAGYESIGVTVVATSPEMMRHLTRYLN